MVKSILAIIMIGFGLKDAKALWALMVIVSAAVAGILYILTHQNIGSVRAAGDLAMLDIVGCVSYAIALIVF